MASKVVYILNHYGKKKQACAEFWREHLHPSLKSGRSPNQNSRYSHGTYGWIKELASTQRAPNCPLISCCP